MPRSDPPPRPGSTLLFRLMNPELFYTVPKPIIAVGAAVVAVACANTARLIITADRDRTDAADDDEDDAREPS